ncbi:MAG: thermonuclease family protein [Pirellulales bacterium]|nr:thermonuclease family protein [Pirellulales bacterium]
MVRRRPTYRRPTLRGWQRVAALALALAILALLRWWFGPFEQPAAPEALAEGAYQVEKVVDGDTFVLTNGAKIRLIGADTPETVHPDRPVEPWGPEATEFTRRFLAGGEVHLVFDRERKDRYGRFLAYVWVDDEMLNESLIRAGLARARTEFRYAAARKTLFRRAEAEARSEGRGIWSGADRTVAPAGAGR